MAYSSKLANYLLYTPFDNKSNINNTNNTISKKLSIEEFFKNCYSSPIYTRDISFVISNERMDECDSETRLEAVLDSNHKAKTNYENFENWLIDPQNNKIYTISGNAGTGKTTFINYQKYNNKDFEWVILDVDKTDEHIKWFGDTETTIKSFNFAYKKMYATVLNKIYFSLFIGLNKDGSKSVSKIFTNLNNVSQNYKNNFSDLYPSGESFFTELSNTIVNCTSEIETVRKCAKYFQSYFDNLENTLTGEEIFYKSLDIFLLILRCLNSKSKNTLYVIAFDNLERFINHKEIYNLEIDSIRKSLGEYSKALNVQGSCHAEIFKFVMVIRTNTARMCGVKLQSADELASNIDLNGWFSIDDIIDRKKTWFNDYGINDFYINILEQITGDLRKCSDNRLTGLKLQIDPLFNYNTRLIVDFVGTMLEKPSNAKYIKLYNKMWDANTQLSRFAARSIIKGLIFNELENNDNLFKNLKAYSNNNGLGLGHARKILTILYNNEMLNPKEHDMSLNSIINQLFHINNIQNKWENIEEEQKKTISDILYYMNSYNRRENDWIQFIDIQYENSVSSVSINSPNELKKKIELTTDNFRLNITPSGKAYLKYIVPSFEYFSVRYFDDYTPLFATVPTPTELDKEIEISNLKCIKLLDNVTKQAINCIKQMETEIDIKLLLNSKEDKKLHKHRIIQQHIGYIDGFIEYINEYKSQYATTNMSIENYRQLINKCIEFKKRYNNI